MSQPPFVPDHPPPPSLGLPIIAPPGQPQPLLHKRAHGALVDKKLRKNANSRARAAKLKLRIHELQTQPRVDLNYEELELLTAFEKKRLRKNDRSKTRSIEKKDEMERILTKTAHERSNNEESFLSTTLRSKHRKNVGDRLRRQKMKFACSAGSAASDSASSPMSSQALPMGGLSSLPIPSIHYSTMGMHPAYLQQQQQQQATSSAIGDPSSGTAAKQAKGTSPLEIQINYLRAAQEASGVVTPVVRQYPPHFPPFPPAYGMYPPNAYGGAYHANPSQQHGQMGAMPPHPPQDAYYKLEPIFREIGVLAHKSKDTFEFVQESLNTLLQHSMHQHLQESDTLEPVFKELSDVADTSKNSFNTTRSNLNELLFTLQKRNAVASATKETASTSTEEKSSVSQEVAHVSDEKTCPLEGKTDNPKENGGPSMVEL